MQTILLVGFAGLMGTIARYSFSTWVDQRASATFPIGTLLVNALGCLLVGFLFQFFQYKQPIDPVLRMSIFVGFLGGFTTFSAFGLQTFTLVQDGEVVKAVLYVTLSNVIGLTCVWLGFSLSKSM
jgi:fluoride exporter